MISHVADALEWTGPGWVYSQWVMETHAGGMARRSKSKSETNRNMSNEILLSEQFNHLIFTLPPDGIDVYRICDDNDSSVEDTYDAYISTPSLYRSFLR